MTNSDSDLGIRIQTVRRESILHRLSGSSERSKTLLEQFTKYTKQDGVSSLIKQDARMNAELGQLTFSHALNLEHDDQLDLAHHEVSAWTPLDPTSPSTVEKLVMLEKDAFMARLLRLRGSFAAALEIMSSAIQTSDVDDIGTSNWRLNVLSQIAEMQTELGQCDAAQSLLLPILASLKSESHNKRKGRQIQLTLAESYLRSGSCAQASEIFINVNTVYKKITSPDAFVQRSHFRALVGLARVAHNDEKWTECLQYWQEARDVLKGLVSIARSKSQTAVILYSIAIALHHLGQTSESKAHAVEASGLLAQEEERRFWHPGLDSYWRDFVSEEAARLSLSKLSLSP